tara:strand:- start:575 stop:1237 length:663 start_codon:yes stop_codon:yes gene_type:complete
MIELLSSSAFYIVNKKLANILGINSALLLADLISKKDYFDQEYYPHNDWFFNTEENIKRDTNLTGYQQRECTKKLIKYDLIEMKLIGIPAKKHFKINEQKVLELLDCKNLKNLNTTNDIKTIITNNNTVITRRIKFVEEVYLVTDISDDIKKEFCDYWCELNKSQTKMKYEMQKTWELNLRLRNWIKNNEKWNNVAMPNNNYKNKLDQQLSEYKKGLDLL